MNFQPILRRYGYGAARLPIGLPLRSGSLAADARTPAREERYFAAIPALLFGLTALFLTSVTHLVPVADVELLARVEPTTIEFDFEVIDVIPPVVPAPAPARAEPSPSQIATLEEAIAPLEIEATPTEAVAPAFDPRDLVVSTRLTHAIPDARNRPIDGAAPPRPRIRPARPIASDSSELLGTRLAGSSPSTETLEEFSSYSRVRPSTTADERSFAGPPVASAPAAALARSMQRANGAGPGPPSDVLAALASESAGHARGERRQAERSAIATAAPAIAMAHEIRERVANQARAGGWHEIPLDELPDCSPPGRQDQLKKEILFATHGERICSYRGGSYRFLETRNLNAFLMWSRTNSDVHFEDPPVRDVCDVLTRALRCLKESSTEEQVRR